MQEKLQSFSAKVYGYMAGALVLSGLAAALTAYTPLIALATNPIILIIVAIIEIVLVIWLSAAREKLSPTTALVALGTYAVLNGFTLSYIFLYYELGSIFTTFIASAFFFGLLAFIGRTTKMDLSKLSTICLIGLIAVMIVSVVNIFLGNDMLALILNVVGIVIFMGLTLYDHQKILQAQSSGADLDTLAVPMALQVYLDFINIFLRLLEIFGKKRD